MCADSILSFPSVFLSSLLYLWCVWCDTKSSNHPISIPLPHLCFSPHCNTCVNPPSSTLIASLCGCVWSGVFPPVLSSSSSSYPAFLGEGAYALGARGGNSPARRGDWGETLLISRSADNLPVCAIEPQKYHSTTCTRFQHVLLPLRIWGKVESSSLVCLNEIFLSPILA